jgi:hypothetical protein
MDGVKAVEGNASNILYIIIDPELNYTGAV